MKYLAFLMAVCAAGSASAHAATLPHSHDTVGVAVFVALVCAVSAVALVANTLRRG